MESKLLAKKCHEEAAARGWWPVNENGGIDFTHPRTNVGEKLCLIHSEISEAMEADRKGLADDKLPHRKGVEVELADAVIRIFDLAGALGLDVVQAMEEKMEYNAKRADHDPENRAATGGKRY